MNDEELKQKVYCCAQQCVEGAITEVELVYKLWHLHTLYEAEFAKIDAAERQQTEEKVI